MTNSGVDMLISDTQGPDELFYFHVFMIFLSSYGGTLFDPLDLKVLSNSNAAAAPAEQTRNHFTGDAVRVLLHDHTSTIEEPQQPKSFHSPMTFLTA